MYLSVREYECSCRKIVELLIGQVALMRDFAITTKHLKCWLMCGHGAWEPGDIGGATF